jgi:hypothetical protein
MDQEMRTITRAASWMVIALALNVAAFSQTGVWEIGESLAGDGVGEKQKLKVQKFKTKVHNPCFSKGARNAGRPHPSKVS